MYYIYALTHPQTGIVHYIGVSKDPRRRWKQHLNTLQVNLRHWLDSLPQPPDPGMLLLDMSPDETEAYRLERFHIKAHRVAGFPLINIMM